MGIIIHRSLSAWALSQRRALWWRCVGGRAGYRAAARHMAQMALPMTWALMSGHDQSATVDAGARQAPSLLVADDNRPNRILMETLLTGLGCPVTLAAGGAEALEIAAERPFDLIMMDIEMPGMSGFEALGELRAGAGLNGATPVVALTAHAGEDHTRAFLAAGFVSVLVKPFSPDDLAHTINRCARRRAATNDAGPPAPRLSGRAS